MSLNFEFYIHHGLGPLRFCSKYEIAGFLVQSHTGNRNIRAQNEELAYTHPRRRWNNTSP
jgi:hypothetical protein